MCLAWFRPASLPPSRTCPPHGSADLLPDTPRRARFFVAVLSTRTFRARASISFIFSAFAAALASAATSAAACTFAARALARAARRSPAVAQR